MTEGLDVPPPVAGHYEAPTWIGSLLSDREHIGLKFEQMDEEKLFVLHGHLVCECLGKKLHIETPDLEPFGSFATDVFGIFPESSLSFDDGGSVEKSDWHLISNIHFAPFGKVNRTDRHQNPTILLGALDSVKLAVHLEKLKQNQLKQHETPWPPEILFGVTSADVAKMATKKLGFKGVNYFEVKIDPDDSQGITVVKDGKVTAWKIRLLGKIAQKTTIIAADTDSLVDKLSSLRQSAERIKGVMEKRYGLTEKKARIMAIKTLLGESTRK